VEGDLVMLVTVLMAVYNPPLGMLRESMDSILEQSFTDLEFLIVNDGSTVPETAAYLDSRVDADDRVRVLHEPHRGLTLSLNRGLEEARGELIARQDADDWSSPDRLATQVAFLAGHPEVALCGTDAWTHQENGRRLWRTHLPGTGLLDAFPKGNPMVHGSTMFRTAAARSLGGYCEVFRCSQDYDFFWRMSERWEAVNLDQPLYHYRYTGGSVSANRAEQQLTAHGAIRQLARARQQGRMLDPSEALKQARAEIGDGMVRALLKQADHLMLAGHYTEAGRSYLNVLRHHPGSWAGWGKLGRLGVFWTAPGLREACSR
jgi:glycosyltransferase involved in cell wall biosynthesis